MHTTTTHARIPTPDYDVFVEGEVVLLKSGGPAMTVIDICEDCGDVTAAYRTSDGDIDVITFPPEALVRLQ